VSERAEKKNPSYKSALLMRVLMEGFAILPLISIFLYLTLAIHARLRLGHWPNYAEYYQILCLGSSAFNAHDGLFGLCGFFSIFGLPVTGLLAAALGRRFLPSEKACGRIKATFLFGWTVFFFLFMSDPFGFSSAFIDS
jgi:hypothetical protein